MLNNSTFDWSCHRWTDSPQDFIPETLARQLPHKSLVAIVEHELRHVQRWDGLLLSLVDFCKCLHWFNPIVYWCERNVRQSIEHGVDRSTLQTLGASNTQAYGELLIQIAQQSNPRFSVTQMASRGSTLRTRIKEITMPVISTPLRTAAALGLVTLLTFTLLSDKATTQEAKPKSTKPSESETSSQLENKSAQTDVISGVVVDENGDPIVGAIIVSYSIIGSQEVRLITGHDGRFVIDLLQYPTARSKFMAAVFKAGHILSSVDSWKLPIRVVLAESKSFEVEVRSPDGQPVQNALVTPGTVRFETFNPPPPESLDRDIATSTDANGRATLTSVQPAELLSLVINSGEWGKQQFALPRYPTTNQKTFVARLRKVGRVVGRITDKTGMPLQGFKFGCASSVLGANNSQGDSASTDVDGRFRMILPTGRYRFFASVGQEIAFEPVTVQISREKEVSLELQVQPPCEVSGRAITDSGLPLENLHVTAWRLGDSRTVLTDAQGHFVFKLPPGNWSYDCYPGETLGLLPNEHNEQAAFKVPEGGSMSLPTIIAKTGQIIEGQIQGIDL